MASVSVALPGEKGDGATRYTEADLIEVVICTPTGFKTVKVTPDGKIHEEAETHADCRWCQTFGKVGFLPAPTASYTPVCFENGAIIWSAASDLPKSFHHENPVRSRAPPA